MSKIKYGMTRDYRKEWGVIEAVRELVQNCIDNKECNHSYKLVDGKITITTSGFILPLSTFALGESQHKTSDSIGGFGEGFKLALLVLEREGCNPFVTFGEYHAEPSFEYDELLERETFVIELRESVAFVESPNTEFSFDFPMELKEELEKKVTVFSDEPLTQDIEGEVELLEDRAGQIFVNGLFVCEEPQFKYGYNFSANSIQLGCDRHIANPLGLAWETSRYWANHLKPLEVLQMMTDSQLDVQDIHWHLDKPMAIKITEAFIERYGNVTIKSMGSTLSYGMSVGNSLYNTLRKSEKIKVANPHEEAGTPYRILVDFLEVNKKHMRRCAKKNLQELLDEAKSWRK